LLGTPRQPLSDPDVKQQIARFHRPGFKNRREKEIERRMRDYLAGRTTKFCSSGRPKTAIKDQWPSSKGYPKPAEPEPIGLV
jgi:hypothetical protein